MKLSIFITTHLENILFEWDVFAKTLFPASPVPRKHILRDHAKEILQEIARDIEKPQTTQQQAQKSKGQLTEELDHKSAAAIHGYLRHISGFTLLQLTSEYRALRATVFRLWTPHMKHFTSQVASDMTRFNEAMDQALAESVVTFSASADRTRDTFLAMLGHDLRSPLFVMSMAGSYLTRPAVGTEETRQMGARVVRSTANMTSMINDLLEYARTQLGGGIPLTLRQENLQGICQLALDEAQAGHPQCPFVLEASGDLSGSFDAARLQQLFSNLLNNAARYRTDSRPVTMTAHGDATTVTVGVRNHGTVIPAQSLQAIFDPLVQLSVEDGEQKGASTSSLGLGLFIAREITSAHGGTISVESDAQSGTVFTVELPRTPPPLAS
jgi:signal transduction histidine kinase